MIENIDLPREINKYLKELQAEVLKKRTFKDQKKKADKLWKNRTNNKDFKEVRSTLKKMGPIGGCCLYCESNTGNQIEHFRPKSRFPECAFEWENFLPACGECNLGKGSKFQVYMNETNEWYDVPKTGIPSDMRFKMSALLNPRHEDPMEFLGLELGGTFLYYSRYPKGTTEYERANYTVDTLGLNKNEILRLLRENAYHAYISHLQRYMREAEQPDMQSKIKQIILNIPQATVWWEMKRQSQNRHHELNRLFQQAPEAWLWSHKWIPKHDQAYLDDQASGGKYPFI